MDVLLCGDWSEQERSAWLLSLAEALPEARWLDRDEARRRPQGVEVAVVANPAPGTLQGLPSLKLIQSLWAGVDRLLADTTLPPHIPIARMVDPTMNAAMSETALWAVLSLHRGFFAYARQQSAGEWRVLSQRRADEINVTVLGVGEMGLVAARRIAALGYRVRGWSARPRTLTFQEIEHHSGFPALPALLATTDVLVNLLPLTPTTLGLLDARCFAILPPGASIVNLARGAHVVEADLLAALNEGHLRHAVLDVFETEPLPPGHPFWSHPRVTVLPHAAALTDPRSAAGLVAANVRAFSEGRLVAYLVDRERGY